MRIFIVDDDEMFRDSMIHYLTTESDVQIKSFSTGENCLESLYHKPDVIFLDYYLNFDVDEAMNGLETLKRIKEAEPDTQVVMLTKAEKPEIKEDSLTMGAYDYIVKDEDAHKKMLDVIGRLEN